MFVHGAHGQHDMGVGVPIALVMDCIVYAHALGDELFPAVIPNKIGPCFAGKLARNCHDDATG